MSSPLQRPLIDRRRSSSRNRLSNSTLNKSPSPSPVGSPSPSSPPPLKSALKHNHIHIDASTDDLDDDEKQRLNLVDLPDSGLEKPKDPESSGGLSSTYSRRVGFDTFDSGMELESTGRNLGGGTGVHYSFTVSAKSSGFCRTKQSRTFLVGTDLNEYSVHALTWLLSSLIETNDEIVVLRVIEPGSSAYNAWKASFEEAREEAEGVMEDVMKKNIANAGEERKINVTVEFAIGEIEETIHRMIEIYNPDSLIVGTRGQSESIWKSAFMGSISKYCVARSPVPVVVVRPEDKVRESLSRRTQDPKRRSYLSLVSNDSLPVPGTGSGSGGFKGGENGQELSLERVKTTGVDGDSARKSDKESKKEKKGREFKKFGTFS